MRASLAETGIGGTDLESGPFHEVSKLLVAARARLALLAGAQRAGSAVSGRLRGKLGLQARLAELVSARSAHWRSQHTPAQGAVAFGEALHNLQACHPLLLAMTLEN
jgi:hypothetical protein